MVSRKKLQRQTSLHQFDYYFPRGRYNFFGIKDGFYKSAEKKLMLMVTRFPFKLLNQVIYIRPCWIFHRVTVTKSWLWSVCAWTHIERFLFGHPFSEATERRGNPRPKLGDQCLGASTCNRQCGAKMPAIDVARQWLWRNRSAAANRLGRCNKFDR